VASVWRNWAGDQRCAPAVVEDPASEEEVAAAVARARDTGRRLRAVGSGHSFTDIACTDGHMVRLGRMDRVLGADRAGGLVRVQPGITLARLGEQLAEQGLDMENQGDIDAQALAGAVSTGTHGTGAAFPNLSAQVVALRLITADGSVVELSRESEPEAYLAARVGLGALGVISELSLRCLPQFTLRRVDDPRPLQETLAHLDELVDAADHFELFAFPYTGVAMTRTTERSDRAPEPDSRATWLRETVLENRVLDLACRAGRAAPSLVPTVNRALMRLAGPAVKVERSHRVYATRRDVRFTEMEYALPRAAAAVCIERIMDLIERRGLPVGFPIEVRFVAADDAHLSPAHARETAYVAVHMYQGTEFEGYFRGVEAIAREYGGRPHWGKRHYRSADELRDLYPEWDRFQAVRARLDPTGLFGNDYTDRVLGPVPAGVAV
jgi:L-gulono-1,4-lactone dehydrogenase